MECRILVCNAHQTVQDVPIIPPQEKKNVIRVHMDISLILMEYALDVEIIAAIAILNKLVMFANRDIDLILIIIV